MIIRNPYDREDLKIGRKDRVLEVGPGKRIQESTGCFLLHDKKQSKK